MYDICAVEIPAASYCNLDCVYCYISKCDALLNIHKRWQQSYEDGSFVDKLYRVVGPNLEYLSLWGTEPTLGAPAIVKHVDKLKARFPRLSQISLSTNVIYVDRLIETVNATVRGGLKMDIQLSLDGPAEYTDKNRGKGVTATIERNIDKLLNHFNTHSLEVPLHFKPTLGIDDYRSIVKNKTKLIDYIKYFDDLIGGYVKKYAITKNCLSFVVSPTCVFPGKYTQDDGKTYAEYSELMLHIKDSLKLHTLDKNIVGHDQLRMRVGTLVNSTIPQLFRSGMINHMSCSAGRSMLGVDMDENVHMCHRGFWLTDKEFLDSSVKDSKERFEDRSSIDTYSSAKLLLEDYGAVPDPNSNNYDLKRVNHIYKTYHNGFALRYNFNYGLLLQLQVAGLVSSVYTPSSIYTVALAMLISTQYQCPADFIAETGSPHVAIAGLFKLLGNGAFETVLREVMNDQYRR